MENLQFQVDQIFEKFDHTVTPGCALAVVRNKEIIYKRGYGMANLEYGIPIEPDTVFDVASVSKQFTALAAALLDNEGKLSLDDDVRIYVPELPDYGNTITLKHLIYHTSGLRDQWGLLILAGWRWDDVITMDDILELVSKQQALNFKPGDNFIYCNTGYTLLSLVIQRVTGKSLSDFCKERIFSPLGMEDTHFHDDYAMVVKKRAYSYFPAGGNLYKNAVLNYANVGATGLFTTVEDLALWDREFYEGRIFGKSVIDRMHTRGKLNNGETLEYAYGLQISAYRGLKVVEHGGGEAGFRTHLMRFPGQNFSVIIFSNLGTTSPAVLSRKIADIYLKEQFVEQKEREKVIELPSEKLQRFTGLYFNEKERSTRLLEMRKGKLFLLRGSGLQLEPVAEDTFRLVMYPDVKIKFEKKNGGYQLVLGPEAYGRRPLTFDRMEVENPSEEDLETCMGVYTCPELEISYRLLVEEGKLMLQRRKYGKQTLDATIKDGFTQPGLDLNIFLTRNKIGQVNGMTISLDHVKNLRFLKQLQ
jgi:CubicO group peptidase (beta-lactamase class C family)